jgi:hypothetical protein
MEDHLHPTTQDGSPGCDTSRHSGTEAGRAGAMLGSGRRRVHDERRSAAHREDRSRSASGTKASASSPRAARSPTAAGRSRSSRTPATTHLRSGATAEATLAGHQSLGGAAVLGQSFAREPCVHLVVTLCGSSPTSAERCYRFAPDCRGCTRGRWRTGARSHVGRRVTGRLARRSLGGSPGRRGAELGCAARRGPPTHGAERAVIGPLRAGHVDPPSAGRVSARR